MFKKAVLVEIEESQLDKEYWDKLNSLVENKIFIQRNDPNFMNELKDCDCLLVGFQIDVSKQVIDAAPKLKYIGVLATAYGTVDTQYAATKGVPVSNLAGYSTESVAEFTIAIILWQIRNLQEGWERAKKGNYSFEGIKAHELKNSQFGVIGLGSIGNRVAELASGFGAKVSYWSRSKKDVPFMLRDLDELLSSCDYISVNVAETPETTNLLNLNNIRKIKSGAVLVSTVPPPVINTDALSERLSKGDITFIFDHPDEMSEGLGKLTKYENCKAFGPIAFLSDEARQVKQEMFVGNLEAALSGKPTNTVN